MEQARQEIWLIYDQLSIGHKPPKLVLISWSKKLPTYEGSHLKGHLAGKKNIILLFRLSLVLQCVSLFKKSLESKDDIHCREITPDSRAEVKPKGVYHPRPYVEGWILPFASWRLWMQVVCLWSCMLYIYTLWICSLAFLTHVFDMCSVCIAIQRNSSQIWWTLLGQLWVQKFSPRTRNTLLRLQLMLLWGLR